MFTEVLEAYFVITMESLAIISKNFTLTLIVITNDVAVERAVKD